MSHIDRQISPVNFTLTGRFQKAEQFYAEFVRENSRAPCSVNSEHFSSGGSFAPTNPVHFQSIYQIYLLKFACGEIQASG